MRAGFKDFSHNSPFGIGIVKSWTFGRKANFAYALHIEADYTFAKHLRLELMDTYNSILSLYFNAKDVQNFGNSLGVRNP